MTTNQPTGMTTNQPNPGARADDVQLRDVAPADLPSFFEQQQDPDANRMAAFPPRDEAAFHAHWEKVLTDDSCVKQTIVHRGEVVGNIGCFGDASERLVGYWIGEAYWGRGIATRALAEFLAQVRERPLYAYVAKHNAGSLRVLEKNGFRVCGQDRVAASAGEEEVEELILTLDSDTPHPAF